MMADKAREDMQVSGMEGVIRKLAEAPGPPGQEGPVRSVILELLGDRRADARADALGNLIVRVGPQAGSAGRVLVTAPIDEIGLMVSHVSEDGIARFTALGEPNLESLAGRLVRFPDGPEALIGAEPAGGQGANAPGTRRFFLDFGGRRGARPPVQVGDVAVFATAPTMLGERMVAKALKHRAGVAVLLEVFRRLGETTHEVVFAFTVQGQVGSRGAPAAAFDAQAEVALTVGVCPAEDAPGESIGGVSLGRGPALLLRDAGMVADAGLSAWLGDLAEARDLACQAAVMGGHSAEAQVLARVRAGARIAALMLPGRYLDSPAEMIDLGDLEQASRLLLAALEGPIPR
jgi:endoglucanase